MARTAKHWNRRFSRIVFVVSICVLLAMLSVSTVCLALDYHENKKANEDASEAILSMSGEISDLTEQNKQLEQQIEEQQKKLDEQESDLEEKDKTIKSQKSSISKLKSQLAVKQSTGTTAPTTRAVTTGKKIIALTFDDGPGPYTARLLDELKKRQAHATFFIIGKNIGSYSKILKRMEDEGHVVGNHSQSHKNLKNMTVSAMQKDIRTCSDKIKAIIGHDPLVMRCPGGNCNDAVKAYAKSQNMPIIYWSVDTRDWESRNVDSILKVAFQSGKYGIHDGAIVLMHDVYPTSVDAAVIMMDRLIEQGYEMVTVPELLAAKHGTVNPGQVYTS